MLAGAGVNAVSRNNNTPLHLAIGKDHVRLAKDLLLSGANPKARGFARDCPIHVAARVGRHDVGHALAHKGADLDALNVNCMITPISLAVEGDHVSTVKVLLAAGADAKRQMGCSRTALHVAAKCNKAGAIPALIEAGADIEARMSLGRSPLWYAACKGSCAAMLVLLQLGADAKSHDEIGRTCLYAASQKGHADAADLLLRWGADETAVDNEGATARRGDPRYGSRVHGATPRAPEPTYQEGAGEGRGRVGWPTRPGGGGGGGGGGPRHARRR
ncbi:unnamed protein product, partial [Ectocarpus sp. 8 AP-2014]